ncbi:MAG: hypothetical protein M3154_03380 [Candidatus Eremiobacteraeota bacterium]|nr:hypothetical protein [Candidatus Eremiobacteraeota bacterium]
MIEYHPNATTGWVVDVPGQPATFWPRVIAAYDRLGIPVGETDTKAYLLGTSSIRVTSRLGGTRLSEYLDCGSGPIGNPAADAYVVTLRATTELKPGSQVSAPFTTIRTLLSATAKPNTTQGDPVVCASTGLLETRIARLITTDTATTTGR